MWREEFRTKLKIDVFEFKVLLCEDIVTFQWFAVALEKYLASQAPTKEQAVRSLERVITATIQKERSMNRLPLNGLPKAPEKYWERYKHAKEMAA